MGKRDKRLTSLSGALEALDAFDDEPVPQRSQQPDADTWTTASYAVKTKERDALLAFADEHEMTLSSATRYAVRYLLRDLRAGKVEVEYRKVKPKMPE